MAGFPHGKLSYMRIPASEPDALASFYASVFNWDLRGDSSHRSFTDASGEMIGAFVRDLPANATPGVLPYISVDDVDAALERLTAEGAEIVTPAYDEGGLKVATFRDPQGNVMGIWWMPPDR